VSSTSQREVYHYRFSKVLLWSMSDDLTSFSRVGLRGCRMFLPLVGAGVFAGMSLSQAT